MFTGEQIIGTVFLASGSVKGKYTANINARTRKGETVWGNLWNLIYKESIPSDFLLREVLLNARDFDSAVKMLYDTRITSSVYYIISGLDKNDGVVIERNPDDVNMKYQLNDTTWFLV